MVNMNNFGYTNQREIDKFNKIYYQVNSYEKLVKTLNNWFYCPPLKDESKFYFDFRKKTYLIEYRENEHEYDTFCINIFPKGEPKKGFALYGNRKSEYLSKTAGYEKYIKTYLDFVMAR